MSKGILISAVCAVAMLVASVSQAGQPSASKMRQMGLYGVPVVSDAVAMEVRGFGYRGGDSVTVWGNSYVKVSYHKDGVYATAESDNGYHASGDHFAIGVNLSAATILVPTKEKNRRRGGEGGPSPVPVGIQSSQNEGGGGGGDHIHLQPIAIPVAGGFSAAYAH